MAIFQVTETGELELITHESALAWSCQPPLQIEEAGVVPAGWVEQQVQLGEICIDGQLLPKFHLVWTEDDIVYGGIGVQVDDFYLVATNPVALRQESRKVLAAAKKAL